MPVTLERRSSWMSLLLAVAGVAGISIAAAAWLTSPQREPAKAEAPPLPSPAPAPAGGKIHVPLFVDPALVRPTPRFRFTFDPPEALALLRAEENLDQILLGATNDLARVTTLMHWARAQWEPGVPSPYPPIDARIILKDIRRGFTGGFCAQYNYVLAQALQSVGIAARYVTIVDHEVIEALLPDRRRWVCLDPLNDTLYRDESKTPLSTLQIHQRQKEGKPILLDRGHRVGDVEAHLRLFRSFAVWLKNDHISSPINFADLPRYKVYFLDQPAGSAEIPEGSLSTSEPADLYPE